MAGSHEVTAFRVCSMALLWLIAALRSAHAGLDSGDLPSGQSTARVFGAADGLRNLSITSLLQDLDGFLWLGTEDGVYRFDGARFTHFSTHDGLLSNLVFALGLAPDGTVCVGGDGLVCWDGQRFSQARVPGMPAIRVNQILSFASKLWVATETSGLFVQDGAGVLGPAPGWPGREAIRVMWADRHELLVGDGATVKRTSGDGRWHDVGDVGLGPDRVVDVLRDREGALWIRTSSHLWWLPPGARAATDVRAGLPGDYDASGMAIGPRGDVLVATDHGLAYRENGRWRTMALTGGAGTPSSTVRSVFVDREGTIWIGATGLIQLRGRGVIEHHGEASGLPGDAAWSYQRDRDGALWIGTNRCLARAVAQRWTCLPGSEGRAVRSIVFPPQGGVFIGGTPSDLIYIAPDGRVTSTPFDHPEDHVILALTLGPEGDLWIGTRAGLFRLPGAIAGRPLEHVVLPGTHPDTRVSSFAVAGDALWTVTLDGVLVREHGAWRLFDAGAGLRHNEMRYVAARADGRICATYTEPIGLSCFRYDGVTLSQLEHIGPDQGLTSGKVYLVGEDRRHRLWVGTGAGVDVVTDQGIDHLDEHDGLAGNDSTANAFVLAGDGSLWLGAIGGATHVFAQYYDGPPHPPSVAFLRSRLGDQSIRAPGAALAVPHDRNALMLEFASSSLLDAGRIEYEVKLSPDETAWSVTRQREVRYPALPPGTYRFEVRARIDGGRWGRAAALDFEILPAWWQTSWFFALNALAIAAAFAWWSRRRTRRLHARSDAGFRAVVDLMPDLISAHRNSGRVYFNVAIRRFFGIDLAEDRWHDRDLADRVHADDRAQIAELFRKVTALEPQHASEVIELRMCSADGSWRVCEMSGIRVDIGGELTVVLSGRDITERKRLRAKLLVSDRMASLGTLVAGIAHEINNPLAYVTGNLEAVAEILVDGTESQFRADGAQRTEIVAAISDARDGADRVRKIVHGLRMFSRSEEEKRVPVALPGVLDAAIRLTSNEIRHRGRLVREFGPAPLVLADDGRLTQVFINLLVNAAHAIPEGRSDDNRITVRTRADDQGRAVIEVEDTGVGMTPEVQSRVFDPFFTTKDVGGGTGLGLSICHGIISGLGGQIAIDSAPGRGTTVRVVLPPASAVPAIAPAASETTAGAATEHKRHRVMLVDDEPQVAHTMERLLRRDHDITVALCGDEALAHITAGERFDVIVSDVMMPNMTGIELLEQLRSIAPGQAERLIFLSGGAFTAQAREQLASLGVLQLEKPVTAKELRASIVRIASGTALP
ncbi:MAG TPA: ATP-binding protein [Kofleriaceae bacterium]